MADTTSAISRPLPFPRWCLLLVFAVTFLTHARSIAHPFSEYDDPAFVTEPTGYRGLALSNIAWDFTRVQNGHYQPLTYLSYGIDNTLWGMQPAGFHFTNVLLHATNAVLIALLTRRIILLARGRSSNEAQRFALTASIIAAVFWGVHPLRVESVAWVTERRDLLSCGFLVAAANAYLRHAETGLPAGRSSSYWLSTALLLFSLLSKAWGMTFFAVLLVMDVYPLRRLPAAPWKWPREHAGVLIEKVPFAVLGMAAAVMAAHAQAASAGTVKSLAEWGLVERGAQACFGLLFYLWKTVLPTRLAALYELPVNFDVAEPRFVAAIVAVVTAAVILIILRKRIPGLVVAVACYAILVSPVLGIFQSGIQLVADRYAYIAGIPLSIVVGWCAARLLDQSAATDTDRRSPAAHRTRIFMLLTIGVAALALAAASFVQTGYWSSTEKIFARVLDAGYDGPITRLFLGRQVEQRGDRPGAIEHYRAAISMGDVDGESAFALGNALRAEKDLPGAEAAYLMALEKKRDKHAVYLGLGLVAVAKGDYTRAVWAFHHAVQEFERPGHQPEPGLDGVAYLQLGAALDLSGNLRASREYFEKATHYAATQAEATRLLRITDEELKAAGPP